ncbi:PREDICTED: uncharacterized protein LOC106747229 [Dinoponera quadriceps]|uniref:Uncharacterized protein LOC106747229 n=1 Tax=Dinoponera quadriceps TaxID=609295 RepID=A0A6P3XPX8_DINQU|nr:PREDICTED: uncharacterized protein LOC106747229 [Dinoponera quadriceps]
MSLNKFGVSQEDYASDGTQQRNEENTLCLNEAEDFDAQYRKIQNVAQPETNNDVATKQYVDIISMRRRSSSVMAKKSSKVGKRKNEKQRLGDELYASARKNFPLRRVIVREYDNLWQADVVEKRPYARFNNCHHYILTVIDVLSKHAWAASLKTKSGKEVADVFAQIIRNDGRCWKNLQTDQGKEFYNADVQKLTKKLNVNHYSTYSVMKASVVERFNCTLKNDMWKMFTL